MKYCVGIDLGSTTTKAVILGESGDILGRGITNSRSNYKVACDVALAEALIHARFGLLEAELETLGLEPDRRATALDELERRFREQQYRAQLLAFADRVRPLAAVDVHLFDDLAHRAQGSSQNTDEPHHEQHGDDL